MSERDNRIDMLKGFCILLVVWGHLPRMGFCKDALEEAVKWIYTFHMPIFVLITGYLFGKRIGEWSDVKVVCNRMFKPFAVWAFLTAILYALAAKIGLPTTYDAPTNLLAVPFRIMRGDGGGALWYLYTCGMFELWTIAAGWICRRIECRSDSSRGGGLLVAGIVCCGCYMCRAMGIAIHTNMLPYFLLGYFIRRFDRPLPSSALFAATAAVSCAFLKVAHMELVHYVWVVSLLGCVLWLFGCSCLKKSRLAQGLSNIGRHSLIVYLLHNLISVAIRPLSNAVLSVEGSGIGLSLLFVAIIVAISLLSESLLKRTWLKHLIW